MEKMTLGCYQGFVKRSCLSWVGLAHNKEPTVGNIPSAVLTQHDYDEVGRDGRKKMETLEIHIPSVSLTQHDYNTSVTIECCKDKQIIFTDNASR